MSNESVYLTNLPIYTQLTAILSQYPSDLLRSSSSFFIKSATLYVLIEFFSSSTFTILIPALIIKRVHILQGRASRTIDPSLASSPARYSVEPIISTRAACMIAFISACTLLQSSYRSPRGIFACSRGHTPASLQLTVQWTTTQMV